MSYEQIKKLTLFDKNNVKEKSIIKKTAVTWYDEDTGECIFRGPNKVILPGAGFSARAHFDIPNQEITPSYNTALNLENTVYEQPSSLHKCFLFAVGTDGCGRENSQVYTEDYGMWIKPEYLVPFKYPLLANDIPASLRNMYYGRKVISNRVAYYFKAFETDPVFHQQYIDGTPLDSTVYDNGNTMEKESVIDLKLKITKTDCRDFFLQTTGINDARINSLSLLTCWYKEFNGIKYYQDIRPLTKLHIPNEVLIDRTKGIDIIYQLYY